MVGEIPSGFATPVNIFGGASPLDDIVSLSAPAVIISLVGFMESVSVAKAIALRTPVAPPVALAQRCMRRAC